MAKIHRQRGIFVEETGVVKAGVRHLARTVMDNAIDFTRCVRLTAWTKDSAKREILEQYVGFSWIVSSSLKLCHRDEDDCSRSFSSSGMVSSYSFASFNQRRASTHNINLASCLL